jgi:hypothetical protein
MLCRRGKKAAGSPARACVGPDEEPASAQRLSITAPLLAHFRAHSAVAAVPGVPHFAPSVAPLAHTSETRISSSAQRVLSVPVTTRNGGAGPGSPFGPDGPAGPGGPAGPCGPTSPR